MTADSPPDKPQDQDGTMDLPVDILLDVVDDPSHGYHATGRDIRRDSIDLVVMLKTTGDRPLLITYGTDDLVTDMGGRSAVLPIATDKLAELADELCAAWYDGIVDTTLLDEYGFDAAPLIEGKHTPVDLRAAAHTIDEKVAHLAGKGRHLLRKLLEGDSPGLRAARDFIMRKLTEETDLAVTFDSQIHLPWPLLAIGAADDPMKTFLGYRHRLEYTGVAERAVDCNGKPRARPRSSHYADTSLNGIGRADAVHKLLDARTTLRSRTLSGELFADLDHCDLDDDLMYVWCHGTFRDARAPQSALTMALSDPLRISGNDIEERRSKHKTNRAPAECPGAETCAPLFNPFVLLNACHAGRGSASVDLPQLGSMLILYGAKGVLGPLFQIPTYFASYYAHAFIEAYLDGRTAGEITRDLVHHFHRDYRNPLGLAYALHCGISATIGATS